MTHLRTVRKYGLKLLPLILLLSAGGLSRTPSIKAMLESHWREARAEVGLVLRHVDFEGLNNVEETDLHEAVGPIEGRLIDEIDLKALGARIEGLAWVERADIRRHLPDRLAIRITERTPFALWQHGGALALVDRHGTILTDLDLARWRHLPLLVGEGAPQAAPAMLGLLQTAPDLAENTEALIRVGGRRWDLKLKDGPLVRLPSASNFGERAAYGPATALARFAGLERRYSLLARDIAIIDLRLADRLAVRLTKDGKALLLEGEQST